MTVQMKTPFRVGEWLPSDHAVLEDWLQKMHRKAMASTAPLCPSVRSLKELIETDARVNMYFTAMFDDVPSWRRTSPTGAVQVADYETMLKIFNVLMTEAPEFNESGLVGFPFNAVLDWSMATVPGWAGFLDERVNAALRDMLNEWGAFLTSPASASVLNEDPRSGWFGADALAKMPDFAQTFECNPAQPHWGYTSWDHFFTRRFRPGVRPIAAPDDDSVIVNACESAPYRLAEGVKMRDRFWVKGQNYALQYMLDNHRWASHFDGGTIYQAFLSATSYHRWHAPVSGRVLDVRLVPGTYYSEALAMGVDPSGPNESQGYIAEVATRGLIFIEADNPDIGLMAFSAIGMAEVSTCEITVTPGQRITKGDQLGMFHFGGSTHCLFFRPGVPLEFDLHGQTPGLEAGNIDLCARIASVAKT